MENEITTSLIRLSLSLLAGGLIGLERTHHGRPAGIRTHTLVCMSSTLLMLLSIFQWDLVANAPLETIRVDPTRMAQGIMTGIGFLGAGVILKESMTIRGLTTAGSIWMTASLGIVIGMGLYPAALTALILALIVLTLFRKVETFIPIQEYGRLIVSFTRHTHPGEDELRTLIQKHKIRCFDICYELVNEGKHFQYQMTVNTICPENFHSLSSTLANMDNVLEFSLRRKG